MSRRRRYVLLSLAAVVVGLAVGVWTLWPQEPEAVAGVTRKSHARIPVRATQADVEALLGGPGADVPEAMGSKPGHMLRCWAGKCYRLTIEFDTEGRMHRDWGEVLSESYWDTICGWFGL
jgi:hypothetical protein